MVLAMTQTIIIVLILYSLKKQFHKLNYLILKFEYLCRYNLHWIPIIGFQNRLQSSGSCLDSPQNLHMTSCVWDSRIKGEFFHYTSFRISLSKVKYFIVDIQKS